MMPTMIEGLSPQRLLVGFLAAFALLFLVAAVATPRRPGDTPASLTLSARAVAPNQQFTVTVTGPDCPSALPFHDMFMLGLDKYVINDGSAITLGAGPVYIPYQTAPGWHTLYLYCAQDDPRAGMMFATGPALARARIFVEDVGQILP